MKGSESDAPGEDAPFVERDLAETKLPYGPGGVPFYIGIAWVVFIVVYIVMMATLALPDLKKWIAY